MKNTPKLFSQDSSVGAIIARDEQMSTNIILSLNFLRDPVARRARLLSRRSSETGAVPIPDMLFALYH